MRASAIVALVTCLVGIIYQGLIWMSSPAPIWSTDIASLIWLFFISHFLFLITISPLLGTYSYLIKVEALDLARRSESPPKFFIRKLPTLLFAAISWTIPSVVLFPSSLFYFSIASASVSDYDGLNPIIESYHRYRENWGEYSKNIPREHLTVVLSSLIGIIAFTVLYEPLGRLIAMVSCSIPIIIILGIVKEVSNMYIDWGLKFCPMCKSWNPIEAVYCRNCGLRIRY